MDIPFNLDDVSVEGVFGIKFCWECNFGKHRSPILRLAKLDSKIR